MGWFLKQSKPTKEGNYEQFKNIYNNYLLIFKIINMNNFFNYIGVADIERVHSSVIAWMLSENCHAFSQTVKSKILRKMFGVDENNITYSKIGTQVESDHIDIVFTTKQNDMNDMKTLWVVENKIKSLEHKVNNVKWQTEEYADKIMKKNSEGMNHFVLLSLTGEDAKSNKIKWHSLKYEDLYDIFKEAERATDNNQATKCHKAIVDEYLGSLWNIIDSLQKYLKNPEDFPQIFHKLPNRDKENLDNSQETNQFILSNNLESIFQIALYNKIVKCIKCCYDDKCEDLKEYNISGSARNGDAEIIFKAQTIGQIGTDKITIAISFQSGTYKIVIAADDAYQSNDTKRWDKCLKKICSFGIDKICEDKNKCGWKFNKPKTGKNGQKPRVSITKRVSNEPKWYEDKTYQELVKIMCDGFNEALDKKKEILRLINSEAENKIRNEQNIEFCN